MCSGGARRRVQKGTAANRITTRYGFGPTNARPASRLLRCLNRSLRFTFDYGFSQQLWCPAALVDAFGPQLRCHAALLDYGSRKVSPVGKFKPFPELELRSWMPLLRTLE